MSDGPFINTIDLWGEASREKDAQIKKLTKRVKAADRLAASMSVALSDRDATHDEINEAQEALDAYRATEELK